MCNLKRKIQHIPYTPWAGSTSPCVLLGALEVSLGVILFPKCHWMNFYRISPPF